MPEPLEHRWFAAWARVVLRLRWPLLALTTGITAFFLYQIATNLRFDSSTEYFASGDGAVESALDAFRADFGRDDAYIVVIEGDVFTRDFLERLGALERELATLTLPGLEPAPAAAAPEGLEDFGDEGWGDETASVVEETRSLLSWRQTVGEGGGIRVRPLVPEIPDDLGALRARALADPVLAGNLVGEGGRHTVISVRAQVLDEAASNLLNDEVERVAAAHDAPGFRTGVAGLPALNATLNRVVQEDAGTLIGVAFAVMALVLWRLFRTPLGVVGPLSVVAMAAIWTLGAMAVTGTPVTLLTNIVPAFLACAALGDSVHVQSVYRDLRYRGTPAGDAVVQAVGSTGLAMVFTTLTTAAGVLSFRAASTVAIQEMGTAAAFGVLVALVHSLVFLPILLSFGRPVLGGGGPARSGDLVERLLVATTAASETARGRRAVLLGTALFAAVSLLGASRLDVRHNPLLWLKDLPTATAIRAVDTHIGGAATVQLVIDADGEHGVKDLELLRGLEALDAHVKAYVNPRTGEPLVTSTTSLLDVVRETHRALHGDDPAFYRLPDDQRALSDALLLFENAGPDDLRRLVTADFRRTHLTIRIHWLDATAYVPFTEHIEAGVREHIGARATIRPTGAVYSLVSVIGRLVLDLLASFGVAFAVITTMMMMLLRDWRLGLVSMVPNLVPVAFVLGFMGYAGIHIDLSNLLVASILLGIVVDDTIHYLHHYRVARHEGVEAAIAHVLRFTGRALVSTSLVLMLGFSVYLASRLASIQRFGVLVGMTCVVALFCDLVVLPALLRTFWGERAGERRSTDAKAA